MEMKKIKYIFAIYIHILYLKLLNKKVTKQNVQYQYLISAFKEAAFNI